MDHLHEVFDHVNGLDVKDENQILDPPPSLRSPREQQNGDESGETGESGKGEEDGGEGKQQSDKSDSEEVPAQSRNAARDVETKLKARNPYQCRGLPCRTNGSCRFLGCRGCAYLDAILPGGGGVCI